MKMFKIGDIVVIEEVEGLYIGADIEGSIVQFVEAKDHSAFNVHACEDGTLAGTFIFLDSSYKTDIERFLLASMKVRKIDRPLKFRGGKVINVEEATSPF